MLPLLADDLKVLRTVARFESDGHTSVKSLAVATGLDSKQIVASVDALRHCGFVDVCLSKRTGNDWMEVRLRDEARRILRTSADSDDE